MSQEDEFPKQPLFGRGIEDKSALPIFYRGMMQKLQNCGVQLPEHAKMLEVGSGNGNFLNFLKEQGIDVEGVDKEPRGPNVKKADIVHLSYEDETFDLVMSKQVFDSVVYEEQSPGVQKAMLSEIVRVLKKGGVYYAMEYFFEPIDGLTFVPDPTGNQTSSVYKKI